MSDQVDPYGDPRLAALYDEDNPAGPDHDFFRRVATQRAASSIVDLGCGTGLLTVTLAGPGRSVLGVDPAAAMLAIARSRAGADRVRWKRGDAGLLQPESTDLVIMSGNVAQHLVGEAWVSGLRSVRRALVPSGALIFESRNPTARAWETWDEPGARNTRETRDGPLTEWMEVAALDQLPDMVLVTVLAHNVFERTREHLRLRLVLAFRSAEQLHADLTAASFGEIRIDGGWHQEDVLPESPFLVVTAEA